MPRWLLSVVTFLCFGAVRAFAQTPMFTGPVVAITTATNASPPVLTTATNTLNDNDTVLITFGNTNLNKTLSGISSGSGKTQWTYKCHPVTTTSCTLLFVDATNPPAPGAFSFGSDPSSTATLTPLGIVTDTTSPWFSLRSADRATIHFYSTNGSTGTCYCDHSSNPIGVDAAGNSVTNLNAPVTPAGQGPVNGVVNPTADVNAIPYLLAVTGYVRARCVAVSTGSIYAQLEAWSGRNRVW